VIEGKPKRHCYPAGALEQKKATPAGSVSVANECHKVDADHVSMGRAHFMRTC
jgi:hypothetical protein